MGFIVNIWFASASVCMLLAASMTIQPEQEAFGWILFAALLLLFAIKKVHGLFGRVLFIVLGGFISLRYLLFRVFFTMQIESPAAFALALMLFMAECYAIGTHFLGLFLNVRPVHRPPAPVPAVLPTIDVFIPTYDEDPNVAMTTALACKNFDYPAELIHIYILDDGCRLPRLRNPELREALWQRHTRLKTLAGQAGVTYLTRQDGEQAKAGMIRAAFSGQAVSALYEDAEGVIQGENPVHTSGDLVLFLDCDHIPTRDLPKTLVGYFEDPKVFLVQTPHFVLNADPLRKNIRGEQRIPCESWLFYQGVMKGLDRWNGVIFCGSAAVMRRTALDEVGGLCGETITEDAETALALHSRGYTSVYVNKPLICGLAPESVPDMLRQRARWCQGMMQMLLLKNPLLQKGLSLPQRLSYFNCCLYWLFPVFRSIFLLAPLAFLFLGINIYNASTQQVLDFALPHVLAAVLVSGYLYPRLRPLFMDDILEVFQTLFLLPAIVAVCLAPRKPVFTTTRKGVRLNGDAPSLNAIHLGILLGFLVAGMVFGLATWQANPFLHEALAITLFWNAFNILFVVCAMGAMFERRQRRESHRFAVDEPVELDGMPGRLRNLSGAGFQLSLPGTTFEPGRECRLSSHLSGSGASGGFSGRVRLVRVEGDVVNGSFMEPLSQGVVGFVFGDSARWQRHMDDVLQAQGPFGTWVLLRQCLASAGQFALWLGQRFRSQLFLLLVCALFALGLPGVAQAELFRLSVADLLRQNSFVVEEAQGSVRIPVHLSRRRTTSRVVLDLRYSLTSGEATARPEMLLDVDETEVAGRTTRLSEREYLVSFTVPEKKLIPGDRILNLIVRQKNPQPITLNMLDSTVTLEAELDEIAPDNRNLSLLLDPRGPGALPVHVVLAQLDEAHLIRAIRAVQTVALLLKNRPVSVSVSSSPVADRDNILIVDADAAAAYPLVMPNRRFMLLREQELLAVEIPVLQNVLRRGTTRSLKDFGLETLLIRPGYTLRNTPFVISSETRLTPNRMLGISLNMAYSGGFSEDSRLEVYMNGTVLTWISLESATGAHNKSYIMEVPTSRLKQGLNVIGILPRLTSKNPVTQDAAAQQFVTVFNTSTLSLPDTGVYVRLPDLQTLFTDGYPFRKNSVLHLERPTPTKAAALLQLLAFIAQRRGTLSLTPSLTFLPWTGENRNAIVLTVAPEMQPDTLLIQETLVNPNAQTIALILAAPTEDTLLQGTQRLWRREMQEGVHGEAVLVNLHTGELTPQQGETVVFSDVWPVPALAFYTNNYPQAMRLVVGLLILGFSALVWIVVKRRNV